MQHCISRLNNITKIKKYLSSKIAVICTGGFILIALLIAAGEILDIPFHVFNVPPTPINWVEIGIETFLVLMVVVFTIIYVAKLDLKRKQAEDELYKTRDYLDSLLRYANAPIIVWDTEQRITMFNKASERLTGYMAGEVMRQSSSMLFPKASRDESQAKTRQTSGGEYWESVEIPILHKDGEIRIVLWNSANIYDEGGKTLLATIAQGQDVTERKQAEEALQKAHDEMEVKVVERTNELSQANTELAAANKELEAFAYSVSHDLRAPLRSIDGFSQALIEDYTDKLDEQGKGYLQRVRSATQRMGVLIDDLLSLSRVTRSEMRQETVDLSALAQSIAEELQETQPERQVDFVIAPGLTTSGDSQLLHQLMENLLGNAWKFTGQHPKAKIEFGTSQVDGKKTFYVRDDGAGFDMTYADKLFGVFQRLHKQEEFSGTGVGLATVQRIVHRHDGQVWAEGKVEKGATFYFTFE